MGHDTDARHHKPRFSRSSFLIPAHKLLFSIIRLMSTPVRFERLLNFLQPTHYAYNIQLAHLEKQINRRKLQENSNYRNAYRRIKNRVGPSYNARVAKGRRAILANAALMIQRHWRGTRVRKPTRVVFINPNNQSGYIGTSYRAPVLTKIHTAKIRRNKNARFA